MPNDSDQFEESEGELQVGLIQTQEMSEFSRSDVLNRESLEVVVEDHHGEEEWYYAFVDIIFVAAIKNINALAVDCNGNYPMLYVTMAAFLAMMFLTRLSFDIVTNMDSCKHITKSITANIAFMFINVGGIFVMTFFIDVVPIADWNAKDTGKYFAGCYESIMNNQGFIAGFLLTRLSIAVVYLSSSRQVGVLHQQKVEMMIRVATLALVAAIGLFGFWTEILETYWLLTAALAEFTGEIINRPLIQWFSGDAFDENIERSRAGNFHKVLQNRLNLFFLIILGETVLGLAIQPIVTTDAAAVTNGITIMGATYVIAFVIGNQFLTYATQPKALNVNHALNDQRVYIRLFYIFLHGLASFSLLMASGAVEVFFQNSQPSSHDHLSTPAFDLNENLVNRRKLSLGLAFTWCCMMVMRMMNKRNEDWIPSQWTDVGRLLAICGHFLGLLDCIPIGNIVLYHGLMACIPAIVRVVIEIYNSCLLQA